MKAEHLKANEDYFTKVFGILGEGGVFVWKSIQEPFYKRGDKLQCSKRALNEVENVVTREYFEKTFELKP
jgi:hypothetical protein